MLAYYLLYGREKAGHLPAVEVKHIGSLHDITLHFIIDEYQDKSKIVLLNQIYTKYQGLTL